MIEVSHRWRVNIEASLSRSARRETKWHGRTIKMRYSQHIKGGIESGEAYSYFRSPPTHQHREETVSECSLHTRSNGEETGTGRRAISLRYGLPSCIHIELTLTGGDIAASQPVEHCGKHCDTKKKNTKESQQMQLKTRISSTLKKTSARAEGEDTDAVATSTEHCVCKGTGRPAISLHDGLSLCIHIEMHLTGVEIAASQSRREVRDTTAT